jgi:hypothetical protein
LALAAQALKAAGVEFIVAPYEADAQMAYLALNGLVHAVPQPFHHQKKALIGPACICCALRLLRRPTSLGTAACCGTAHTAQL